MLAIADPTRSTYQVTANKRSSQTRFPVEHGPQIRSILTSNNEQGSDRLKGSERFNSVNSQHPTSRRAQFGVQTKLAIGQPGDALERDADQAADTVMRMPNDGLSGSIGHKCEKCQGVSDEEELLQLRRFNPLEENLHHAPESVETTVQSSGRPLDESARSFMETRFGYDFSHVRVHTDQKAQQSAQDVNARAYTAGNHVVFNAGQYSPGTQHGKHLLAHELAHVVQQGRQSASSQNTGEANNTERVRHSSPKLLQRAIQVPAAVMAVLAAAGRFLLACVIGAAFGVGIDYVFQRGAAWWEEQTFRWNTCLAAVSAIIGCITAGVGAAITRAIFRYTGGHLERDFATKAVVWFITWLYGKFPTVPVGIIMKFLVRTGCMDASELPPGVEPD